MSSRRITIRRQDAAAFRNGTAAAEAVPAPRRDARRKKPATPERHLQIACADILRYCVPPPPEGPLWNAVNPVPAAKNRAVGGIAKAMGARAGWPDIDIFVPATGRLHGVEFKAPTTGRTSKAQDEIAALFNRAGQQVWIIRNVEQFLSALSTIGVPVDQVALRKLQLWGRA